MGDERLPAGDRGARRHRRAARRHVRAQAASSSPAWCVFAARLGRSPAPPATRTTLIAGRVLQGVGRGADAAALAGDRLQRLPGRGAAAGARHLGRGLGGGAGDRPARRRRPDRNRLAGDLLDQPAGRRARDRDHGRWRRRSRPTPAPAPGSTGPGLAGAQRRPHRGRPGAGPVAGLGRAADRRARARRASSLLLRLLADRAPRRATRSSTSPSSATAPTSAPAPPPSPSSAPTGR